MNRVFRQSALSLSLLLGCGSAGSSDSETDASETSGGAGETGGLDMQAVLYVAWHHEDERAELWLRRRADAEPELVDSAEGPAERVCVAPDGSGYVTWEDRPGRRRVETFTVGPDVAERDAASRFPEGLFPTSCAMGWSPAAYYVNLTADPEDEDGLPHRVTSDGGAERVDGAESAWVRAGRYAIERGLGDDTWSDEVVVWELGPSQATAIATWTAPDGLRVDVEGSWLLIERRGAGVSIASTADPTREPIVLWEGADERQVAFSASGESIVVFGSVESDAHVEVLRLVGEQVVERSGPVVLADAGGGFRSISDTGVAVFSGTDSTSVHVVDLEGNADVVAAVRADDPYRFVSGFYLPSRDATLIHRFGGDVEEWVVQERAGGEPETVVVPEGCDIDSVLGERGYLRCGEESIARMDFTNLGAGPSSLDWLVPSGSDGLAGVVETPWGEERWDVVVFNAQPDGYMPVLYEPESGDALPLAIPGANVTIRGLLPVEQG